MRIVPAAVFFVVCGFVAGIGTSVLSSPADPADLALNTAMLRLAANEAGAGAASAPVLISEGLLVAPPPGGPLVLPATISIPSSRLPDEGPVVEPLGDGPVSHLHGLEYLKGTYGKRSVGIWECSPGRWRRQIMEAEFAHFLVGHAFFTPDGGKPIEIRAGDTVWFPPNSKGIWDITETSRKTYILIGSTSFFAGAMSWLHDLVAW